MGQANKRGTKEERVKQAQQRRVLEKEAQDLADDIAYNRRQKARAGHTYAASEETPSPIDASDPPEAYTEPLPVALVPDPPLPDETPLVSEPVQVEVLPPATSRRQHPGFMAMAMVIPSILFGLGDRR